MTGRVLVRKVRWPRYASCGHYCHTGTVIVRKDGWWICRDCALAENNDDTTEETPA